MYNRNCPDCGKILSYKWPCDLKRATENNSVCKSCRTTRANKSTRRYSKGKHNPFWKGYEEIPQSWFSRYFERKGRKYPKEGTVTIQDIWELYEKQNRKCALTGLPIGWSSEGASHNVSIDRIDSKIGYHIENIQLVTKEVNIMKNKYSQEYFINMCKLVANNAGGSCEVQ